MTDEELVRTQAYAKCMRLLSKREYCQAQIQRKLSMAGVEESLAQAVIKLLVARNYLSDERFTKSRIKSLLGRGFSSRAIRYKLKNEGAPVLPELVSEMMVEKDLSVNDQVRQLLFKKVKNWESLKGTSKESWQARGKVLRYLLSKGYELGDCQEAMEAILKDNVV